MKFSATIWYYLALGLIIFVAFSVGNFNNTNPSSRIIIILFGLVLILNPFLFLWHRERYKVYPNLLPPVIPPPNPDPELAKTQAANLVLESKVKELAKKEHDLILVNQRLQDLERSKSEFVSVTAHQIRTPLSAIKWTFHMILNGELGAVTADQKDFLAKGYAGVERILTMVSELLNIDYIEAGKLDYKFVPFNVSELVDSVVFEFGNRVIEKEIKLIVERPKSNIPKIEIDPIKMSMVLENLIDNAIKYTPAKGQVTVKINDDKINSAERVLEITVADSGIGIPAAEQGKIFQRFYRSSNAAKMTSGNGLGLAIVKEIIERHGGQIWFESRENEGTLFHFTIPVHQTKV